MGSEMFKMGKDFEDLKRTMEEEKAQLSELEEYFAKIDANKAKADEEDRILSEFKHRMSAAMDVLHTAATNITKVERGRQCRRELAKSKKGGKKGKKVSQFPVFPKCSQPTATNPDDFSCTGQKEMSGPQLELFP